MTLTRSERLVKERIDKDLAEHTVKVLHGDGMHRHWRCQKPGSWNMGFDIVTWPGSLCYTGDMGDYLFQRTNDMVAFMRGSCMSYSYAAEKCVAHDGRLTEFCEESFQRTLAERLAEGDTVRVMRYGKIQEESVAEIIKGIKQVFEEGDPHATATAMYESGLWDGGDLPSCKEYAFHFLWCLHALKWFCGKVV
jgi:hypothetical protein